MTAPKRTHKSYQHVIYPKSKREKCWNCCYCLATFQDAKTEPRKKSLLVFYHRYYSFLIQIEWHPEMITQWYEARFFNDAWEHGSGWLLMGRPKSEYEKKKQQQQAERWQKGKEVKKGCEGNLHGEWEHNFPLLLCMEEKNENIQQVECFGWAHGERKERERVKGARESFYVLCNKALDGRRSISYYTIERHSPTRTRERVRHEWRNFCRRWRKKWIFSKEIHPNPTSCTLVPRCHLFFPHSLSLALRRKTREWV